MSKEKKKIKSFTNTCLTNASAGLMILFCCLKLVDALFFLLFFLRFARLHDVTCYNEIYLCSLKLSSVF